MNLPHVGAAAFIIHRNWTLVVRDALVRGGGNDQLTGPVDGGRLEPKIAGLTNLGGLKCYVKLIFYSAHDTGILF
jgi:hypothetical protein